MSDHAALDAQVKLLQAILKKGQTGFSKRANDNRRWALINKMATVLIGAMTTILLALKGYDIAKPYDPYLSITAMILSAIVPIVVAWDSFYEPRWGWIQYRSALSTLYHLSNTLEFEAAGKSLTAERLNELQQMIEGTFADANKEWTDKRVSAMNSDEVKDGAASAGSQKGG